MIMESVKIKAYAKINLHLDVVSKYENGYHEVRTVMQSVSLCDDVEVALNGTGKNSLWCDIPTVPTDEKNIAWRAADMFFERCGLKLGADIRINKRIPVAAGMAGGSTDGAAVFKALNILCKEPLTEDELLELGGKLGADVPFCISGGTKYGDGTGAQLHGFPEMPHCHLVIACGTEGVSTPWAYSVLDGLYGNFADGEYTPSDIDRLKSALVSCDLKSTVDNMYNIFESAVEPHRPDVTRIKNALLESGALGAMMSGSGPSVFGIFENVDQARAAVSVLEAMKIQAFVAEPVKGI